MFIVPLGSPKSIMAVSVNLMANRITWEDIDCHLRNGRIIEYIVIISNNSITYNLTTTERYIIVYDLVFGNVYNMSVAGKYIVSYSELHLYFLSSSCSC